MDVEKTVEFLLEQQAKFDARMERLEEFSRQAEERHSREISQLNAVLRHAVRLGVQEARHERQRRRELDARLSAAQQLTEQKLQRLIDSLNQPRNGH